MNIVNNIRVWYIIKSTEPTLQQLKNAVFLLQYLKTVLFFENQKKKICPPPPKKSASYPSLNFGLRNYSESVLHI